MLMPFPPAILDEAVKPYFEVRERLERRIDRDFASIVSDNRTDLFSRWRVGLDLKPSPDWRLQLEYQYAHDLVFTKAKNFSTENSDASLFYGEAKKPWGTVTVGRQKLSVGSQRLIGSPEWLNVPRSYDGVRFRDARFDAWAMTIGVASPRPRDAKIAGLGFKHRAGETTLIYKHDQPAAGNTNHVTLDHAGRTAWSGVDVEYEAALQDGKSAGIDHSAWAFHVNLSKKMTGGLTPFVEFNAASGGSNPTRSQTFDNLYPTNHNKYGIADMQSWRNMNEIAVGAELKAKPDLRFLGSLHFFSLRDPADSWYGAGGGANRGRFGALRDPVGASGTNTGSEFDLEAWWTVNKSTTLHAGFAIFNPGDFVRKLNGGVADTQYWGFVSIQGRF